MSWLYNGEIITKPPQNCFGFIYKITRLNAKKGELTFYIGKKQFYFKKREKSSVIYVDSDWLDYYGSSDLLRADVEKFGKDNFKREIIHLAYSKQELTYMELNFLFTNDVLHNNSGYYNASIGGKFHKCDYKKYEATNGNSKLLDGKVAITNGKQTKYVPKSKVKLFTGYTVV